VHELMHSLTSNLRWIMDTVFEKNIQVCNYKKNPTMSMMSLASGPETDFEGL